jgi:hypothetical protein
MSSPTLNGGESSGAWISDPEETRPVPTLSLLTEREISEILNALLDRKEPIP